MTSNQLQSATPRTEVPLHPDAAQRRAEALRRAAQAKRDLALTRTEAGIRRLIKTGGEINFRTVARAAEVSLDFLYSHPDLRRRIEDLRDQQRTAEHSASPQREPSPSEGTVIHTLTTTLRRERATHREHVQELEQRLAAAHGELLRLRRRLQEHGLDPR